MFWSWLLIGLFLIAAVISGMALMSGSGHPHPRRRSH
jgi:hypothetical protein